MSYTTSDYHDCPGFLRDYLFYLLTIKGRSKLTVEGYYIDLRTYLRFLHLQKNLVPHNTPLEEIDITDSTLDLVGSATLSDVYEFLNYVFSAKSNNANTRARKVSAIRGLYKYLTNNVQLLSSNPVENLELPATKKALPAYLTLEQCYELLGAFDPNEPHYRRDYCMVMLFLNCGMRLSEMSGLNLNSFRDNTLRVLGKGNKERILYLNDACMDALKEYLNERSEYKKIIDTDAMFLNNRGQRIGQRRIQQIITELLQKAGLSNMGFSTHKLRHTAATMMYQYGDVDVKVLQEILGHEHLNTTEIYTHVANTQKEDAMSSNPLAHYHRKKKE
ncbi:MAG: tyrosine-type recombinase/integrase [Candidatus Merdivicinus sp.]|jgi:integrase/recombinase XerC